MAGLDDMYNTRIFELAAEIPRQRRLADPDATATAHSKLCGSTVTVDLKLDAAGRVSDFGQTVKACLLGQAAASVVGREATFGWPLLFCLSLSLSMSRQTIVYVDGFNLYFGALKGTPYR